MPPDGSLGEGCARRRLTVMTTGRTALVRRARAMNRTLHQTYPDARCELDFEGPLQLLVATILSAQTTDKRVNLVTPQLFAAYPDAAALAAAEIWHLRAGTRQRVSIDMLHTIQREIAAAFLRRVQHVHRYALPYPWTQIAALRGSQRGGA